MFCALRSSEVDWVVEDSEEEDSVVIVEEVSWF